MGQTGTPQAREGGAGGEALPAADPPVPPSVPVLMTPHLFRKYIYKGAEVIHYLQYFTRFHQSNIQYFKIMQYNKVFLKFQFSYMGYKTNF